MPVIFLNEPKYSEHEADAKYNDRRKKLRLLLNDFILEHSVFAEKSVSVTFLHTGVSSLVGILDTGVMKYILKIPLNEVDSKLEGTFLKAWENVGVRVPHVFEEEMIGGHFYTLIEFIDADTLRKKYSKQEMVDLGIYRKLGALLRQMHQVKAKGYSNIVNKKHEPEYPDVATWLASDTIMKEQIAWVREQALYNETVCGSIDQALAVLIERVGTSDETIYCHNDFHVDNIFATEPFTVFDPWSSFQHPYMDLARAIWSGLKVEPEKMTEQYIEGYFGNESCDRKLLQAFILLTAYVKSKYMAQRGGLKGVEHITKYLKNNKDYLVN